MFWFPILEAYQPLLTGWIDTYIRHRMFKDDFDPLEEEIWRALIIDDVAHEIAGAFATRLTALQENQSVAEAEVRHLSLSDVKTIPVCCSSRVEVTKCIYPKLPVPTRARGLPCASSVGFFRVATGVHLLGWTSGSRVRLVRTGFV